MTIDDQVLERHGPVDDQGIADLQLTLAELAELGQLA